MGVQIHIKVQDLLEDGWKVSITKDVGHTWDDEDDCEIEFDDSYLTIEKDGYVFHSYTTDSFCADCNDWGINKKKFIEVGLLDIPHILS